MDVLREFAHLPRFPDGRVDYTHSEKAPVINCFVKYHDKVLLLKRSDKVLVYKEKWNSVGGFLDDHKSAEEKSLEEVEEELGIPRKEVKDIRTIPAYEYYDAMINRTWIIHPVLVELRHLPKLKLDWEHTDYRWISPEEINKYDIVPDLDKVLSKLLI